MFCGGMLNNGMFVEVDESTLIGAAFVIAGAGEAGLDGATAFPGGIAPLTGRDFPRFS